MVRTAVISDIHSNLEALTAVLDHAASVGYDRLVCLGDIVGYGADPVKCLELVRSHVWTDELGRLAVIKGNHDDAASGGDDTLFNRHAQHAIRWTKDQLTADMIQWLADLPLSLIIPDNLFLVHSSPIKPERWNYVTTLRDASEAFTHFDQKIGMLGHSHVPFFVSQSGENSLCNVEDSEIVYIENTDRRYLINVGSVGQPRDGDNRACYVMVDETAGTLERHRVPYDYELSASKIRQAGLPEFLADRLHRGR